MIQFGPLLSIGLVIARGSVVDVRFLRGWGAEEGEKTASGGMAKVGIPLPGVIGLSLSQFSLNSVQCTHCCYTYALFIIHESRPL